MTPATLADVAEHAGVSAATASRALNERRYVATATRERVEAAVRALDYIPHRAARDLSLARTGAIALLVYHGQYPVRGEGTFAARVLAGVSRGLRRAGYDLLYEQIDDDAVQDLGRLPAVRAGRTDGTLLLGPAFPAAAIVALRDAGRPLTLIDNRHPGVDAVLVDNRSGAVALARHLLETHRYRRVACIVGPRRWPSTVERLNGYRAVLRSAGIDPPVVHAPETTIRDGATAMGSLLAGDAVPEAVIAVNDAMAIGALHRLRSLPASQRPAVVGFDDTAWAEQLADPPLTTAAVDAEEMGATAARLLVERLAGGSSTTINEIRVPTSLRVRQSCGCTNDPIQPITRDG